MDKCWPHLENTGDTVNTADADKTDEALRNAPPASGRTPAKEFHYDLLLAYAVRNRTSAAVALVARAGLTPTSSPNTSPQMVLNAAKLLQRQGEILTPDEEVLVRQAQLALGRE